MGAVNPPAICGGPPDQRSSAGALKRSGVVQLQAHTRQVQPAPQVDTAEAVACW